MRQHRRSDPPLNPFPFRSPQLQPRRMQITLVVPEIVWPEPDDHETLAELAVPGLATLLARSRMHRSPAQSLEAAVGDAFGYGEPAALAACRVHGEESGPAAGCALWLCADPVHLRLHQERLILADAATLEIDVNEAQAIVDALNRHFPDAGRFHFASSDRWYLELAAGRELGRFEVPPLSTVAGRSVVRQLPETAEARWLRRLLNEAQMVLHEHPVNRQRDDAGRATINSLWLWGAGRLPTAGAGPFTDVWSDLALARGCGRAAGSQVRSLPDGATALLAQATRGGEHLVVLDGLQSCVQYEDGAAYRATLLALEERWFAPLQQALASGRIRRLCLQAPTAYGMLSWEATHARSGGCGAVARRWRRPPATCSPTP